MFNRSRHAHIPIASAAPAVGAILLTVALFACVPTPAENEAFVPWVIAVQQEQDRLAREQERLRQQDCLMAGLSPTIASSGVLICVRNYGDACYPELMFSDAAKRSTFLASIDQIYWDYSPACSTAAANATTDLNALSLPAHALLRLGGGTVGTHRTGLNYAVQRVESCEAVGMHNATFLGGASSLADETQMFFLTSPRGLVAVQDATGACRSALGLSAAQATIATSYRSGTLAMTASCDYGVDDPALTDCPASLRNSTFLFSGITDW